MKEGTPGGCTAARRRQKGRQDNDRYDSHAHDNNSLAGVNRIQHFRSLVLHRAGGEKIVREALIEGVN